MSAGLGENHPRVKSLRAQREVYSKILADQLDSIQHSLKTKLGIAPGETTADGLFTLTAVECLAACGTAPMMQINDDYYERLTEEKVDRILADLRTTGTSPLKSGPYMWPESTR